MGVLNGEGGVDTYNRLVFFRVLPFTSSSISLPLIAGGGGRAFSLSSGGGGGGGGPKWDVDALEVVVVATARRILSIFIYAQR